jgi:hypothetical protein
VDGSPAQSRRPRCQARTPCLTPRPLERRADSPGAGLLRRYGSAIVFTADELTTDSYREIAVGRLASEALRGKLGTHTYNSGTHTYNFGGGYEVIDALRHAPRSRSGVGRLAARTAVPRLAECWPIRRLRG